MENPTHSFRETKLILLKFMHNLVQLLVFFVSDMVRNVYVDIYLHEIICNYDRNIRICQPTSYR